MRSARSWFNLTLFKKNMTRFWPVWGLYLVIWLIAMPVFLILHPMNADYIVREYLFEAVSLAGPVLSAVFALMAAAAVWFYLCGSRSVCLMHTLPIRREGLFLTNFLSGMAFLVGPNLAVFLLTLLAEAAVGRVDMAALLLWLFSMALMELFFFCTASFCAMFTGHVLGLPAFYVIGNMLAAGLAWLLDLTLSRFVFGYVGIEGIWKLAKWLTPVWKLESGLEVRIDRTAQTCQFIGLGYILIYAFLGLILAALALLLYRCRDMERAGDIVTVPRMRPVFQYGVAFCCALAFGALLYEIFRAALPTGAWTLLCFMLVCGAAGYFLARMLLEKSFRVFHCWKGCVPFLAALVVLVCVMEFDLTGFERRVPDEEDVAMVQIVGMYTSPYDSADNADVTTSDPAVIRAVLAAHQIITENKDTIDKEDSTIWVQEWNEAGYYVETGGYVGFQVVYTLNSGAVMTRNYTVPVSVQEMDDSTSPTAALNTLFNLPQVVEAAYGLSEKTSLENLVQVTLTAREYSADDYAQEVSVKVNQEFWAQLLEAVRADLAEGNLGRRYLLSSQERMENCLVNQLQFVFYLDGEQDSAAGEDSAVTQSITIELQTTAEHTLAVLEEQGVLESPVRLITQAQLAQADMVWWSGDGDREDFDLNDYTWAALGE